MTATKYESARSFTFVSDKDADHILLSLVDGNGAHHWYRLSDNQIALALSQLAQHVADRTREQYPHIVEAPCDV